MLKNVAFAILLMLATLNSVRADEVKDTMEQGNNFFATGQFEMAIRSIELPLARW